MGLLQWKPLDTDSHHTLICTLWKHSGGKLGTGSRVVWFLKFKIVTLHVAPKGIKTPIPKFRFSLSRFRAVHSLSKNQFVCYSPTAFKFCDCLELQMRNQTLWFFGIEHLKIQYTWSTTTMYILYVPLFKICKKSTISLHPTGEPSSLPFFDW